MDQYVRAGAPRRWKGMRVALALVLGLAALRADAFGRVDPGEQPELAPDEGLLVVAVDSDMPLGCIRFQKVGSSWKGGGIRSARKGRTTELYVLPAGRYQWSKITIFDTWVWTGSFDLADDDAYAFDVKAGRINYAGDLVYRSTGFLNADIRLSNRALPVLDWLQAQHPALSVRLPFAYTGRYPDPFPDFYRQAREKANVSSAADLDAGGTAPAPGALPLAPRLLWQPGEVEDVALSPDGQLVAVVLREEEAERWALNLVDVDTGVMQRLAISDIPFRESA